MKRTFHVSRDNPKAAQVCESAIAEMRRRYGAREGFEVEVREPRRTLDANAAMWATLADIAAQVDWPHTEDGKWLIGRMDSDSWKAVLTAGFEAETRMAQGVAGGSVMLGARTSKFSKRRMGEFLEFVHAFGTERGVRFSDKALEDLAQWAPAERSRAA